MKKYIITISILIFLIISSIGGFFIYTNVKAKQSSSRDILKEKCMSEIEYLSNNIISVANKLNNISYIEYKIVEEKVSTSSSNENTNSTQENSVQDNSTINYSNMTSTSILTNSSENIDWNNINVKIQDMYSSWTTIMIDLSALNTNKENLLKFNKTLDEITKNIENRDVANCLINLVNLYSLLPLYITDFYSNNEKLDVFKVKYNILYSYAQVENENWTEASNYIENAKNSFSNTLNNQVNNINKIDIINKVYILINELKEDCNTKIKKIFLVNYSNLMRELENL